MELKNDYAIKSFIGKDRERDSLVQLFKSEFPKVQENLSTSRNTVTCIQESSKKTTLELENEKQLNDNAKKKIRILQN
jgi:hypothetical protein